ncbi:MAG TPA: DUF4159 domain-containing protein [Geminicoccus sp.]|uniref:DUF4159 domain-containing protein n=1 Tax=Geminicoccus sp. TaxID=2024832 RepID=UPI002C13F058|nr:DUF4159 domain-containing protein [Geminicoccus sp.]HWL67607.1 DUF4159 domain-containing protein [Geminicoccus sp.]
MPWLGSLAFAQPLVLAALLALPAIWLLLRVIPPSPKRRLFPPIRLLLGIQEEEKTSARMPWWLLALRTLLAALLILAVAGPVLQPIPDTGRDGPLLLVVDDGFAAAPGWSVTRASVERVLTAARREGRPVVLLRTAGTEQGVEPVAMTAPDALAELERRGPASWPADRAAALAALDGLAEPPSAVWWFADGTAAGPDAVADAVRLAARLRDLAPVRLVLPDPADAPLLLRHGDPDASGLAFSVERAAGRPEAQPLRVLALAGRGEVLAHADVAIAADQRQVEGSLDLPIDLRNQVERLEIDGRRGAGETVLVDERWRRRSVGIVAPADEGADQPLLAETWYIDRALSPYAEVRRGTVAELIEGEPAAMVLPDAAALTDQDRAALRSWIDGGGVLIRFAGPRLAAGEDPLVPVPLRFGDRQLGGALTWTEPLQLAPFPTDGPFAGLRVPDDVTVRRQVLARPGPDLTAAILAALTDGTPLVTGRRQDDGWLVLIHTTADPAWTDLPLSGLFVDMLRRLTALGRGDETQASGSFRPLAVLSGAGMLAAPPLGVETLDGAGLAAARATAATPPGFWAPVELQAGDDEIPRRALDVGQNLPALEPVDGAVLALPEVRVGPSSETELGPWLLAAAFILALADLVITMVLRGHLNLPARLRPAVAAAVAALMLLGNGGPALAQAEVRALEATESTRLAWVRTGIQKVDEVSAAGLEGLSLVLRDRTSVEPEEPLPVDVEADDLALYPLLYWPVPPEHPDLSEAAIAKVGEYLRHGGMILFDTGDAARTMADEAGPGAERLAELFHGLDLPPLAPVDADHALSKSFYLMPNFPGRFAPRTVWVDTPRSQVNDGVSTVIVASSDFAGAWAVDRFGASLLPVTPGGEEQREMARRVGVNLVMYALTGNYKTDQVHVPALLERLGQ